MLLLVVLSLFSLLGDRVRLLLPLTGVSELGDAMVVGRKVIKTLLNSGKKKKNRAVEAGTKSTQKGRNSNYLLARKNYR